MTSKVVEYLAGYISWLVKRNDDFSKGVDYEIQRLQRFPFWWMFDVMLEAFGASRLAALAMALNLQQPSAQIMSPPRPTDPSLCAAGNDYE